MTIPTDTNAPKKPALNTENAGYSDMLRKYQQNTVLLETLRMQEQEKRDTTLRAHQSGPNELDSLCILQVLVSLLTGIQDGKGAHYFSGNTFATLSEAFGLQKGTIRSAARSVQQGADGMQAAYALHRRTNPGNVDWHKTTHTDVSVGEILNNGYQGTLLHPKLVAAMENNPLIAQRVQMTFEAADRHGMDGAKLANQIFFESSYNPYAVSRVGAIGIAQMMPDKIGKWGIETRADLNDPEISIEACARFMKHLTLKHGSQEMALVAYNGGGGAIKYADKNVAGDGVNIDQWMEFMAHERATKGAGRAGLWRNETYNYIKRINPQYWDKETLAKAIEQKSQYQPGLTDKYNDETLVASAAPIDDNKEHIGANNPPSQPAPDPEETPAPILRADAKTPDALPPA